ncbi:hypothetical protein MD588_13595 [Photobacterium sp. SDRW27]|uniref:hypothetical protein n=1 Tax=Photobacterium obscurum TaxID=2829490 RepID=UPI0022438316|nr:hypothetical protein [Photobacterium obscurum]MCW8329842.1 hypothetical protein [Photobacterium obscurum]
MKKTSAESTPSPSMTPEHKQDLKHEQGGKEQFPISETRFWIQRLSKTGVRALHILGIAGSAGGILYGVERGLWLNWWILAMTTGVIMMSLEISRSKLWVIQLKGVLTFVKLGLLASFFILPQHKPVLFITVLLMSVFVAHGPAGLRHYSIWHRRRIDEKQGKKKRMNG